PQAMGGRQPPCRGAASVRLDLPCFAHQHDRDAVADRERQPGGARHQLLLCRVVMQGGVGHRADQRLEHVAVEAGGGRGAGGGVLGQCSVSSSSSPPPCSAYSSSPSSIARRAARSGASSSACFSSTPSGSSI